MRTCRILAILVFTFCSISSAAAVCLDYDEYMHWASMTPTGEGAGALATQGDLAFVGAAELGLQILDISNSTAPQLVATLPTPDRIHDVAVAGDIVFLTVRTLDTPPYESALWIVDIAEPATPTVLATLELGLALDEVVVQGDFLYSLYSLYMSGGGLCIVDVSDPAAPFVTDTYDGYRNVSDLVVTGSLAHMVYAGSFEGGYQVWDVSDSSNIVPEGTLFLGETADGLAVAASHAFVTSEDRFHSIDIADPANPTVVGEAEAWGYEMVVADGLVYLAGLALTVVDVSDPAAPQVRIDDFSGGGGGDLSLAGDRLCVATSQGGLLLIELANGETVAPLAVLPSTRRGEAAAVVGPILYYTSTWDSLHIVDVSDPAQPQPLGALDLIDGGYCVSPRGNYAYVGVSSGMMIVDVDVPELPQIVASVPTPVECYDIDFRGDYAYLACWNGGVRIVDIGDPLSPQDLGTFPFPGGTAYRIDVEGDQLYIAAPYLGVVTVDIADPANPVALSLLELPTSTEDIVVDGRWAYVANGWTGLRVLDVNDPANPVSVFVSDYGNVSRVALAGTRLYACVNDGILLHDVGIPNAPRMFGNCRSSLTGEVTVGIQAIFAADYDGVNIFPLHCDPTAIPETAAAAAGPSLDGWPNPFNPHVTLSFSLETAGPVRLRIHDVSGRLVATIAEGVFDAGRHRSTWDGRDEAGRELPTGVYFASIEAEGAKASRKLVLLR